MTMPKLIFEYNTKNTEHVPIETNENAQVDLPQGLKRKELNIPDVNEVDVIRHFTELSKMNYGVDNGFYPLGSCTMKYNPKINEDTARMQGFANLHPQSPLLNAQGSLQLMYELEQMLCEITGMDKFTLQPSAGAHGYPDCRPSSPHCGSPGRRSCRDRSDRSRDRDGSRRCCPHRDGRSGRSGTPRRPGTRR